MFNIDNIDLTNINIKDFNKYFECLDGIDFDETDDNKVNNNGNINKIKQCFNCDNSDIIEDYTEGKLLCKSCGQVLDGGIIDFNPEWKQFDDDDKANGRCSMPINIHLPQSSLGTNIGGTARNRIKRLHGWNSMPYDERSLNKEFKKIKDVCLKGGIMKCVEDDAIVMYRRANESRIVNNKKSKAVITRGINRISISAACVFFACSRNDVIRTSKEIATLYIINDTEMNRGCKNLLKLLKNKNVTLKMGTSKPENFIKRYCDKLKIKNAFTNEAVKIAVNIEKLNIASGHTPYSTAAASILLMSNIYNLKTITKKKLAKEFGISEVTITKTYKEIELYKKVLINNDKTNNIVVDIKDDMDNEYIPLEILERMKKFGLEIPETETIEYKINSVEKLINSIYNFDFENRIKIMIKSSEILNNINSNLSKQYYSLKF